MTCLFTPLVSVRSAHTPYHQLLFVLTTYASLGDGFLVLGCWVSCRGKEGEVDEDPSESLLRMQALWYWCPHSHSIRSRKSPSTLCNFYCRTILTFDSCCPRRSSACQTRACQTSSPIFTPQSRVSL